MNQTVRVGEHDYPLSRRASEWKEIIDEATLLIFDIIALFEKAKELYQRAVRKMDAEESPSSPSEGS